ncbi:hypothetical protein C8Q74DRAFT_1251400, partial [Fomes fomentarius]
MCFVSAMMFCLMRCVCVVSPSVPQLSSHVLPVSKHGRGKGDINAPRSRAVFSQQHYSLRRFPQHSVVSSHRTPSPKWKPPNPSHSV